MAQKTPISLMNELCKANNMVPEYNVIEESGPPHEKTFKVELSLQNGGSYEGVGKTIKGAKHKAAQLALDTCGLTKPIRKPKQTNVAPSVELNSLAMKLGKVVEYHEFSFGSKHPGPIPVPSNAYGQCGSPFRQYAQGFSSYRAPATKITVSVKVGEKEYFGEAFRRKEARRDAALNALSDLRKELGMNVNSEKSSEIPSQDPLNHVQKDPSAEMNVDSETKLHNAKPIKSEISQVYEIASKQKLKIDFDVVSSSGPPHNRMFVTTVTVGEIKATGEGPSKKASKHQASVKILKELIMLPQPVATPKKTKGGRLYKHGGYPKKTVKELDPSLNPISLLGQLRQRRKESLPAYSLVSEEGVRNKEFTIQVQVDSHTARGSGANKKEAKKNAAEAMLQLLGIRSSKPAASGEANSEESNSTDKNQKQNQGDEKTGDKEHPAEGRQLPPGLLPILPEMASRSMPPIHAPVPQTKTLNNHPQSVGFPSGSDSVQSKQIGGTVTVLNRAPGAPVGKPMSDEMLQNDNTPSMKKLQQLAESGGFQVHYQDTTQDNNEQFLAVVTISTVPQLICRGFGSTLEQAFEHAASNALVPLLQPPSGNGPVTNGPV